MLHIGIDGDTLRASLDNLKAQYKGRMRIGVGQAGRLIQAEAKRRCPVDSTRLRESIDVRVVDENGDIVAKIGSNVDYALHVEFGHRTRLGTGFKKSRLYRKDGSRTVRVVPGTFFLHNAFMAKRSQAAGLIAAAISKKSKG